MYTYGDTANSPALAKLAPGGIIIKDGDRLGIHEAIWRESVNSHAKGRDSMCIDRLILIDAEGYEGQWEIGVKNEEKYRAAKAKEQKAA